MTSSALWGLIRPGADVTRREKGLLFQQHLKWLKSTLICQISALKVLSCSMSRIHRKKKKKPLLKHSFCIAKRGIVLKECVGVI